jgi:hypothetical protein
MRDRFVRGVAVERGGGGELVEVERLLMRVSAREVHRELGGVLARPRSEPCLLAPADRAVQANPAGGGDPLVEDAPIERVAEPVASRHRSVGPLGDAGIDDERAVRGEPLASVLDPLGIGLQRGGDGADGELVARDARRFQDLPVGGREPAESAADQFLQPARDAIGRGLDRSVDVPLAVAAREQSRCHQVVDHVDHEERVPLGALVHEGGEAAERIRRRSREPRLQIGRDVVARQ